MIAPPTFSTDRDYAVRLTDGAFWRPFLDECLRRHGLDDAASDAVAGVGGTYPAFVLGDVVVKLFGHRPVWRASFDAERAAQTALAADPSILAPRLLGEGTLFGAADSAWPYLILSRLPGVAWERAELSGDARQVVARALGEQVRRVHALNPAGVAAHEDWPVQDVVAAVARSSLPANLAVQAGDYLARLGPFDRVFVHGDLIVRHVFVESGRLAGIIDWGDTLVTDRHYELAKLHLDLFDGDSALLRAFLEASDWPVGRDFARKAMALALVRQAHGLVQHDTMDVFHKLPALLPLENIATLDDLADALFAV